MAAAPIILLFAAPVVVTVVVAMFLERRRQWEEASPTGVIRVSDDGFVFEPRGAEPAAVRWADVREIVTYRRDLFSYDTICLTFRCDDEEGWVEVWEEDEGFRKVANSLTKLFPTVPEDWWGAVMLPPPRDQRAGPVPPPLSRSLISRGGRTTRREASAEVPVNPL